MMMTTPCEQVRGWLIDNGPSELPAALEAHATTCGGCTTVLATTRRLVVLGQPAFSEPEAEHASPWNGHTPPSTAVRMSSRTRPTRWWGSKWFLGSAAAAALLGVGLQAYESHSGPKNEASRSTAASLDDSRAANLALAEALWEPFVDPSGNMDFTPLREDADLQKTYLEYLEHESGHVRRSAVWALGIADLDVPVPYLRDMLEGEFDETPERMINLAAVDEASTREAIRERMHELRERTLGAALSALGREVRQNPTAVSESVLLPLLGHRSPGIRHNALSVLAWIQPFTARGDVEQRLRADPDPGVRAKAALTLWRQLPRASFEVITAQAVREQKVSRSMSMLSIVQTDPRAAALYSRVLEESDHEPAAYLPLLPHIAEAYGVDAVMQTYAGARASEDPLVERNAYATGLRMKVEGEFERLADEVDRAKEERLEMLGSLLLDYARIQEPPAWETVRRVLPKLEGVKNSGWLRAAALFVIGESERKIPTDIREAVIRIRDRNE